MKFIFLLIKGKKLNILNLDWLIRDFIKILKGNF